MRDDPIFILSVGPRCGSTWLQRVLTSTGGVLIWGETAHLWPVDASLVTPQAPEDRINDLHYFRDHGADMWMATLKPFMSDFEQAYKTMAEIAYAVPSEREGFPRWGLKETKWDPYVLPFVMKSWPGAQVIFLVRNFRDSFMSQFKDRTQPQNYSIDVDIDMCADAWIAEAQIIESWRENPRCKVVKYEDLSRDRKHVSDLLSWCKLPEPDWEKCGTKISFHEWQLFQDVTSYRPAHMDVLWPYRDEIRKFSKAYDYDTGL